MKKIALLFLLIFLPGCNSTSHDVNLIFPPKAFEFSERCPNICWLGINPGKTTVTQAKILLTISGQINWGKSQVSDSGIVTTWYIDKNKTYPCDVGILFYGGLVKTIYIGSLPYKIDDFVQQMGEPDKIRISAETAERNFIKYAVYFSSRKAMISTFDSNSTGPEPTDSNLTLWMNSDFDDNPITSWGVIQPWLGYGHIKDYLPAGIHYPPTDTPPTP